MNNLNSVLIEGNLTRDPVIGESPKGTAVCNFSIANNRYYRQEEEIQNEVSYLDVETWAKLAEVCSQHLTRGRGVRVVGRVKQDRWTDTEGKPHNRVKVVAEHVEFKPYPKSLRGDGADEEADAESRQTEESAAEESSEAADILI